MEKDILEKLYKKYANQVYLYLYSLCHSHSLAEDLTQETFLKAFCTLKAVREEMLPWLFTVARNLYLDVWRREKLRNRKTEAYKEGQSEEDILGRLISKERNQKLYQMVQRLGKLEREAVILYYFTGLSQEEISGVLQISNGNVRVLLYRARRKLKLLLSEDEQEGRCRDEI